MVPGVCIVVVEVSSGIGLAVRAGVVVTAITFAAIGLAISIALT